MKANTRHFAAVVSVGLALMMPIGSARAECSNNQFLFADRNPRVPRGAISKVELEQSSEIMTMVEHEKLVKHQHTDVESAMVRALWLDLTSSGKMLRFALYVGQTFPLQLQRFS